MHWLSLLASLHLFSWSRVMGQRHTSVLPFPEASPASPGSDFLLVTCIRHLSTASDPRLSPLSSELLITFQPCLLPAQPELWPASLRHSHTHSQAFPLLLLLQCPLLSLLRTQCGAAVCAKSPAPASLTVDLVSCSPLASKDLVLIISKNQLYGKRSDLFFLEWLVNPTSTGFRYCCCWNLVILLAVGWQEAVLIERLRMGPWALGLAAFCVNLEAHISSWNLSFLFYKVEVVVLCITWSLQGCRGHGQLFI